MAYDPTIKRYAKDLGVPVPNVEFCPTEFPRLHTFPAPYLPLVLENERHDEHFVVLTGKVVALDSKGFLVPAGLALQIEASVGATVADTFTKYTATDVAAGVKNAQGVAAIEGEPVIWGMLSDEPATAVNVANGQAFEGADGSATTVGDHIGVASYSWLRASSDSLDRAGLTPSDPSALRHMAWEPQLASKTVRTNYCLEYPVVADRSGIKLGGQAVAIGDIDNYILGTRVTYNVDSDITLEAAVAFAVAIAAEPTGAEILLGLQIADRTRRRCVGQIVKKNDRVPSSALDKVRSRWEATGFEDLDKMPGSATAGHPWHLHTAGASASVVISTFMR